MKFEGNQIITPEHLGIIPTLVCENTGFHTGVHPHDLTFVNMRFLLLFGGEKIGRHSSKSTDVQSGFNLIIN